MVQVAVCGGGQLEGPEADVIQGFVVNAEGFVSVFNKLMDWEGGIVGLDNGVADFWGGHNWVCVHDPVWVLFTDFRDKKSSHSRASAASKWMCKLEALQAIARLWLFAHNI